MLRAIQFFLTFLILILALMLGPAVLIGVGKAIALIGKLASLMIQSSPIIYFGISVIIAILLPLAQLLSEKKRSNNNSLD